MEIIQSEHGQNSFLAILNERMNAEGKKKKRFLLEVK